jgi:polyhydroxybutyrate depolymerase
MIAARLCRALVVVSIVLGAPSCARQSPEPPAATLRPGNHTIALRHAGRNRAYIVHVPPVMAGARPVLVAYHGGGGEAAGFQEYAGLDAVADREGFIVVYPFGSGVLPRRLLTWNAGECCGYAMTQGIDDVAFTVALLDDLSRRTTIDRRRVYATGHSNGAMMSYRLAAERSDIVAAIAPVAGAHDVAAFAPTHVVAVLHMHSIDDPRALYGGGMGPPFPGTNVRSSHQPVMEGLERWLRFNRCSREPRTVESRSGARNTVNASQTATLLAWEGCASGGDVRHWKLTGSGHGWPGTTQSPVRQEIIGPTTTLVNAAEEVWRFVSLHRK